MLQLLLEDSWSSFAEWINKWFLVCSQLHAGSTVVIITDAGGAQAWGELRSMESTMLSLHFTDLQCELPPLEPQQRAATAPGRVEQVIPQLEARCHLISLHNRPTLSHLGLMWSPSLQLQATQQIKVAQQAGKSCLLSHNESPYFSLNSRKQLTACYNAPVCREILTLLNLAKPHIYRNTLLSKWALFCQGYLWK